MYGKSIQKEAGASPLAVTKGKLAAACDCLPLFSFEMLWLNIFPSLRILSAENGRLVICWFWDRQDEQNLVSFQLTSGCNSFG